jgi:hypothetical protein
VVAVTRSVSVGDRARVPFAVVAVLLLLGSATLAVSMHGRPAGGADPDTEAAMDRAVSAARTALVAATERAARQAAREPVVDPANTTYGRILDEDRPFVEYLELRVYLVARQALRESDQRVRGTRVVASLPPIRNASDARRAIERVTVERNGTTLQVRVRNVTLTATRDGRQVDRERRSMTVYVESPVLVAHERVERVERRLNRGSLDGPGLGRRLTARLYAVIWARGYAQYGGAPVANVLANRHVELMTNGAALDVQAATFGRADPSGRAALRRAALEVGLKDLLAAGDRRTKWADYVVGTDPKPPGGAAPPDPEPVSAVDGENQTRATNASAAAAQTPSIEGNVSVGINDTADRAFVVLSGDDSLDAFVNETYVARARLVTAVEGREPLPRPVAPDGNWTLVDETERVERTVEGAAGPVPEVPEGWHCHRTHTRRVAEQWTITRTWARAGKQTSRTRQVRRTVRVGFSVVDRHAPADVPPAEIAVVHEVGGPLDGPNLRDTPSVAVRRLVTERGGPDGLARRIAAGAVSEQPIRIEAERPPSLAAWVYGDVASLRERVRNVSVSVSRGDLVTEMDAARRLADRFESRRAALLNAPERYRSVADKVRVAARAAYLRSVQRRLDRHASAAEQTRSKLNESLSEETPYTLSEVGELTEQGASTLDDTSDAPVSRPWFTVDTAPTYLTLEAVDHERVPSVSVDGEFTPLASRNVNVFAVPYGDAADTVTSALFDDGGERTSLRTAAGALQRANRILEERENGTLRERRNRLHEAVEDKVDRVRDRSAIVVAAGTGLNPTESYDAVNAGLNRWEGTHARALATANGSAARAIADEAARRATTSERERDELATRLRVTFADARSAWNELLVGAFSTRVRERAVNETGQVAKQVARRATRRIVEKGIERATKRVQDRWVKKVGSSTLFAGLPVLPTFNPWYATTNVWYVSVRGEYARFTVRSRAGAPERLAYSRHGQAVTVDVDGDGSQERLGTASRVTFSQETAVVIVVPPGRFGVGERDGDAVETSSGWPTAGPENGSGAKRPYQGRQSQDERPARSGHVPRAPDVRAGGRRRTSPRVRRGPGSRGRGRRRRDGRGADRDRPRARRAGDGGRTTAAVGRRGRLAAGARQRGTRRRNRHRDGLRSPHPGHVDGRYRRGPAGCRR